MSTLLEIASVPRTVKVGELEVPVYGVSAEGIAQLMVRFPEIGKLMSGAPKEPMDAAKLLKLVPQAIGAIIAAGAGHPGKKEYEEAATKLALGVQMDFIDEILRLTFPRGIAPFLDRLRALGLVVGAGAEALPPTSQE